MAGVSTKEIKNRIRSMESTKQITKAMEMVASSKLRRAQAQVAASRPYFQILRQTISRIVANDRELSSEYLVSRPAERTLHVVIAGDRGLAGGYNSNLLKETCSQMTGEATVLPIGKKAVDFFRARKIPMLTESYVVAENVAVGDCFSLAKLLCKAFREKAYDRIVLSYTQFGSVLSQTPKTMELLPLARTEEGESKGGPGILYEPDPEQVFAAIIPEYIGGVIYGALCESRASEQAARRTAMDSATQNAEEMIQDLSLKFNRARQAAITQEITEIVAGS